jgi:predicted dehydrogenase
VSLKRERKFRVFQGDAYFSIDFDQRQVRVCRREAGHDGRPPSLSFEQLVVAEGDALANEIGAFVQAVRARETPPVTGWDGLRALEVAYVVRESVETEARAAQFVGHE